MTASAKNSEKPSLDKLVELGGNSDVTSDVQFDVSSAFMEFISLDKPVVLVNNPLRTSFIGFDPRDIEYIWRAAGIEIDHAEDIPDAIIDEIKRN